MKQDRGYRANFVVIVLKVLWSCLLFRRSGRRVSSLICPLFSYSVTLHDRQLELNTVCKR